MSCRTAVRLLAIDHAAVARWLEALVDDRVLTIVERGGTPETPRAATYYRYTADSPAPGVAAGAVHREENARPTRHQPESV
jgi:hypothetical protein